jgi:ABC-type Zn uptake system ZnuABC Zn-binding protein ZnuA
LIKPGIIKEFVLVRNGITILVLTFMAACSPQPLNSITPAPGLPEVLVVETYLADIVRNVAGDRLVVDSLLPINVDAHSYQPAPRDIIKVSRSDVLVINGGGIEAFLTPLLDNVSGSRLLITASDGLITHLDPDGEHAGGAPHFWLDPVLVIQYVKNIRDGLIQADPQGRQVYTENAAAYILQLQTLDAWIVGQVAQIPPDQRLLVTNHESLGYFADRYGFTVIGSIIPGFSSDAAPSARQLVDLIRQIRSSGAVAIFMETGSNANLAEQISGETSAILVTDLHTESVSVANGPAPTYIDMMKYNVIQIVNALK